MLYSKITNDLFINKLDTDKEFTNDLCLKFVGDSNPEIRDIKVNVRQVANQITIEISGISKGEEKRGEKTWTKADILGTTDPVTRLIEDLAKEIFVFEAPSEGTSVS